MNAVQAGRRRKKTDLSVNNVILMVGVKSVRYINFNDTWIRLCVIP